MTTFVHYLCHAMKKIKNYIYLIVSLFVLAFGVALVTKAMLGTSPIASLPFVLSLALPPVTMGQYMMGISILILIIEMFLMTREQIRKDAVALLLQIPTALLFGWFIDLSLELLTWFTASTYIVSFVALLVGCAFVGLGVAMEVQAGVAMMPTDYIVRVIAARAGKDFGTIKVCFDVTLVATATVVSLVSMHTLEGVREGTVIAAVIVGPLVRFSRRHILYRLDGWLALPERAETVQASVEELAVEAAAGRLPRIITITREYCSGGMELGRELSRRLGIPFYDKEIIRMAAQESRFTERFIEDNEQSLSARNLLDLIYSDYNVPLEQSLSSSDMLFVAESRVIRELARKGPCIILGRCGDYVLNDWPKEDIVRVFCYTDIEDAVRRSAESYSIEHESIREHIYSANDARIHHYQYYTGRKWGDPHNYSVMVNTGALGTSAAADMICGLYNRSRVDFIAPKSK